VLFSSAQLVQGYQPIFSLVHAKEVTAFTDDGPVTYPAGSPAFEIGVQSGTPMLTLLLPIRWLLSNPMSPHYIPFTATGSTLVSNNWNNISVTWMPQGPAGLYPGGNVSLLLNGTVGQLVAPANPSPGGAGPAASLPTTTFIPAEYRAAVGVAYTAQAGVKALARGEFCDIRFWTPGRSTLDVEADLQPFPPTDLNAARAKGLVDIWSCEEAGGTVLADTVGLFNGVVVDPDWVVDTKTGSPDGTSGKMQEVI
jgi:hypothetical protein